MMEIPGQDVAGKWNGYLTVENDTLMPVLSKIFGEMMEGWVKSAGCEVTDGEGKEQSTIGKVLECTMDIKPVEGAEGKYNATVQFKNKGSGVGEKPASMSVTLEGDDVVMRGVLEFLNAEIRGKMLDNDNIDGSFVLKIVEKAAAELKISPGLGMGGSFKAVRIKN